MAELLSATRFGNHILRDNMKKLSNYDIHSKEIQNLIKNMYYTLREKEFGVGLAAPQVGVQVSLGVIGISQHLRAHI